LQGDHSELRDMLRVAETALAWRWCRDAGEQPGMAPPDPGCQAARNETGLATRIMRLST
jgi:hypothetical protein